MTWGRLPTALRYAIVIAVLLGAWQAYVTLSHVSPLLVGTFSALTLGRRSGLLLACVAAGIGMSLLVLASLGLGPPVVHFVAQAYPPNTLAEAGWGDFSRATMMRPSVLMQWLRVPTMVGLGCGLLALVRVAYPARVRAEVAA